MIYSLRVEKLIKKQLHIGLKSFVPSDFTQMSSQLTIFYEFLKAMEVVDTMIIQKQISQKHKVRCPICNSEYPLNPLLFLVHLVVKHSSEQLIFSFVLYQKELVINFTKKKKSSIPTEFQRVLTNHLDELQNYLNLFNLFSERCRINNFIFEVAQKGIRYIFLYSVKEITGKEKKINQLLMTKRFYHGPSKNYKPIQTSNEFQEESEDDIPIDYELKNEQLSLYKDFLSIDRDRKFFWTLWNNTILEEKYKRKKQKEKQIFQDFKYQVSRICLIYANKYLTVFQLNKEEVLFVLYYQNIQQLYQVITA